LSTPARFPRSNRSNGYACELTTTIPEADVDWRIDLTSRWEQHDLPASIGNQLKTLLSALNLHYGCIDLRRQPDGEYRFLEVNPSGQFLFAEIDTGQAATASISPASGYGPTPHS
jgi:hypothetical protein